ncbi:hypothetical protein GCM10010401_16340 [Rarobacter faecitabidus]|uniref:Na+/H+ antiporter n=1 Tax=Rarobacter faecitabidus TaxID=13243 RepID=A0A542ZX81_RARFA|nr:hypothetical protein [Rarobacter faecitabidus]TQL64964.1 hypothetical protein FB461_1497 [Rarobacter faecitabidus]
MFVVIALAITAFARMRDVVTLAAASAIPVLAGSVVFPERATVQFAAYSVAIGTLLLQGLTLPWMIRRLGLSGEEDHRIDSQQEIRVRAQMAKAQGEVIDRAIKRWSPQLGEEDATAIADTLRARMIAAGAAIAQAARDSQSVSDMTSTSPGPQQVSGDEPSVATAAVDTSPDATAAETNAQKQARMRKKRAMILQVRHDLLGAQRKVLAAERDKGEVNETVLRSMLREIDVAEESLTTSWLTRLTP